MVRVRYWYAAAIHFTQDEKGIVQWLQPVTDEEYTNAVKNKQ